MPLPLLETRVLFQSPPECQTYIAFRAHGNDYMGLQYTVLGMENGLWDHDNLGGWSGPMWASLYPLGLGINGATYTRDIATQGQEIARVASGTTIKLD